MRQASVVLLSLLISGCVPWTVVPIDDQGGQQPSAGSFDAAAYVDSVWQAKLLPALAESAIDLNEAGSLTAVTAAAAATGTARVLRADTESRTGKLLVDMAPGDNAADAAILIGPVILGTTLRDAAGFIEFSQFTNQLDYADVANELNRRVIEEVVAGLDISGIAGKTVTFLGVMTPSPEGAPSIIPVRLEVK